MSSAIQTVLQNIGQSRIVPGVQSNLTNATIALSSNYSFQASSGAAYGFLFESPDGGNLTDIWVAVSAFSGTWGSTDGAINWEMRDGVQANYIPGSTLTGSGTITLNSATDTGNWVHVGSLSLSLTAGKIYYFVIGDADGGGTNYVTMTNTVRSYGIGNCGVSATTANSWTSGAAATYPASVALKIGGRMIAGSLFASSSALTSNTVERGNQVTVAEPTTLVGIAHSYYSAILWNSSGWSFYIYDGSTNPGGSKLKTIALSNCTRSSATSNLPAVYLFNPSDHYTFMPGRTYNVVIKPSANSTYPYKLTTFGNPDANIKSLFGGGDITLKSIIESSGTWTTDDTAIIDLGMVLTTRPGPTVIS